MGVYLMTSMEETLDPEGNVGQKIVQFNEVGARAAERAAAAGGVDMSSETPDIVFSDANEFEVDVEMPEDGDLPEFGALVEKNADKGMSTKSLLVTDVTRI